MTVVSVPLLEALADRIDTFAEEHGYTGRSEVVREASRNPWGVRGQTPRKRGLIAVLTVVFDYSAMSVDELSGFYQMWRPRHPPGGSDFTAHSSASPVNRAVHHGQKSRSGSNPFPHSGHSASASAAAWVSTPSPPVTASVSPSAGLDDAPLSTPS